MFATFSNIWQTNTFPFVTKNPCYKMANGHQRTWILETSDIHFSSTFSAQNFKGFCGKTNIKINRKVGIKIKIHLEASVHCLSPPNTYSFVQEENLGWARMFLENYLLFTCITNKILALHPWSVGWRNLSKTVEKEFLQPTHSKCNQTSFHRQLDST